MAKDNEKFVKIVDIDELFDKYISDYVYANIGKVKPEEIENQIPVLYEKFGDEKLKELDGKTPNEYYKEYPAEQLIESLRFYLESEVPVSDFLCEAIIEKPESEDCLVKALSNAESEEFIIYLMNMLGDMESTKAKGRYLEFVLLDYSEGISELATELLSKMPDEIKDAVLASFNDADSKKKENLTEILSGCKKDERVFEILIEQFKLRKDNLPLYANYLAKYGDERALPVLYEAIEQEKISYSDFEELRFAIEALGGTYEKERDFTADKTYKKIRKMGNTKLIN